MPPKRKNKGKKKGGNKGGNNGGAAAAARSPLTATTPTTTSPPKTQSPPKTTPTPQQNSGNNLPLSSVSQQLPNLVNQNNDTTNPNTAAADDGSDGSYSIPPLAKRDDSSSSGSDSSQDGSGAGSAHIPPIATKKKSPTKATDTAATPKDKEPEPPIKSVEYNSSSADEDSGSDDESLSGPEDKAKKKAGTVENESDDDSDDDGMPALVVSFVYCVCSISLFLSCAKDTLFCGAPHTIINCNMYSNVVSVSYMIFNLYKVYFVVLLLIPSVNLITNISYVNIHNVI